MIDRLIAAAGRVVDHVERAGAWALVVLIALAGAAAPFAAWLAVALFLDWLQYGWTWP